MTEDDPIAAAMREAQRLSTKPPEPNPFEGGPAVNVASKILDPKLEKTIRLAPWPRAALPLDTAIRLRWALRDIKGNRTKYSPVSPQDLIRLTEMGLVEMKDDILSLTDEGHRAIRWREPD
jgi:hypothetical protein